VASTDTNEPSLISRVLDQAPEDWGLKALLKSVRIRQADEALMMADRAAGLAADRSADKHYKTQQARAVTETVNRWMGKGNTMPKDEDDAVNVDLGDRYEEHRHYHGRQGSGLLGKLLPWALAAAMGPVGALLAGWWFNKPEPEINVRDVESKFKVEVYDEQGRLLDTYPYSELKK
jgi:hypothetical protein